MAAEGFQYKCLRCAVFSFNIICFFCALLLIAVGGYVQVMFSDHGLQLQMVWKAAPIAIIVIGVVILLVSLLGCCGALKENSCMLYTYGVLLVIFLIAEIAAAIVAVVNKDDIDSKVEEILISAVKDYKKPGISETIDKIQSTFECCGGSGPSDYTEDLPPSCRNYKDGCAKKFGQFLKEKLVIVACVAFGVCFIQLLSIIVAFCFGKRAGDYHKV